MSEHAKYHISVRRERETQTRSVQSLISHAKPALVRPQKNISFLADHLGAFPRDRQIASLSLGIVTPLQMKLIPTMAVFEVFVGCLMSMRQLAQI